MFYNFSINCPATHSLPWPGHVLNRLLLPQKLGLCQSSIQILEQAPKASRNFSQTRRWTENSEHHWCQWNL